MSERLLLAQQRRGYRSLRFVAELEAGFAEHRVQRIRRRLPLIAPTAALFQLIYALLDFLLMPLTVSLSVLPLRLLALAVLALSFSTVAGSRHRLPGCHWSMPRPTGSTVSASR